MADASGLRRQLARTLDQKAARLAGHVEGELQREARSWPYATGFTAQRITARVESGGGSRRRVRVRSDGPRGGWRERGTRPHVIPRGGSRAQVAKGYPLRFVSRRAGRVVFAWSVNHPGTRPRPWFYATIRRALRSFR